MNKIPKGFNNNIIWNIAHVIVTQQILIYEYSDLTPLIPKAMINDYRKGTKPERMVAKKDIEMIKSFLFSTIESTNEDYKQQKFKSYKPLLVSTKSRLTNIDEAIAFNNFHEGIHLGYILALKNVI